MVVLPEDMKLMKRVCVSDQCRNMSHHDGDIYVAVYDFGVDRISGDGQLSQVIPESDLNIYVEGVCVHDNLLYTLVDVLSEWSVRIYDSDYHLILKWPHIDSVRKTNQLIVQQDCVLIPNRDSKTLIEYNLAGQILRQVPCHILKDDNTCLCATSTYDTVVVTCGSVVCCINMTTGVCKWTNNSLNRPTAICSDEAGRLYVAEYGEPNTTRIAILDGETGKRERGGPCHTFVILQSRCHLAMLDQIYGFGVNQLNWLLMLLGDVMSYVQHSEHTDWSSIYGLSLSGNSLAVGRDNKTVYIYELI